MPCSGTECAGAETQAKIPTISETTPLEIHFPVWQVRHWKTSEGLPGNWIECVLQTADGYLWLGTPDGLYRFNGIGFTTLNSGNCRAFESDVVKALVEDRAGALWVATKQGVLRLQAGGVRRFDVEDGLGGAETTSLSVAPDGAVWVGTSEGVSRHHDGEWTTYRDPQQPRQFVYSVLADSRGVIWVGAGTGLRCLAVGTGHFTTVWEVPWSEADPQPGVVRCISEARQGGVWFGTDHRVFRYQQGELTSWRQGETAADERAKQVFEDDHGRVWAIIGYRLNRLDGDRFVPVEAKFGLADAVVNGVGEDRDGNLWVGSRYAGLTLLRPLPLRVITESDGLPHNHVVSVSSRAARGVHVVTRGGMGIWVDDSLHPVPTPGGLEPGSLRGGFEDAEGRWWVIAPNNGVIPPGERAGSRVVKALEQLWGSEVRSMVQDRHGDLWFASDGILGRLVDARIPFWPRDPMETAAGPAEVWRYGRSEFLRTLPETNEHWRADPEGVIWTPVDGDYVRFDPTTAGGQGSQSAWTGELITDKFPSYSFTAVAEDAEGALWLGTEDGGLARLRDWQVTAFTTREGLASDQVTALLVDSQDRLWVGTDQAISVYQGGKFRVFDAAHGFPTDRVSQLLEDDFGNLWIGGELGIYRLSPQALLDRGKGGSAPLDVRAFTEADGLLSTEVPGKAQPGACRDADGRLLFPTTQGLVVIDPREIAPLPDRPPVQLELVRANGRVVLDPMRYQVIDASSPSYEHPLTQVAGIRAGNGDHEPEHLTLAAGSGDSLEVHYTALNLCTPQSLRFQYRLEGLDHDWIQAGTRRTAYYTNLKPGRYSFHVRVTDPFQSEIATAVLATLALVPFWHETAWFRVTAPVVLLSSLALVLLWYLHQVRRRHALERDIALREQRERIGRDLHDDLGNSLGHAVMQVAALREGWPVVQHGGDALLATENTLRAAYEALRDVVWASNPKLDSVGSLARRICQWAEERLHNTTTACRFDLPERWPNQPVSGHFRRELLLAAKEAFSNIARHSGARHATVRVRSHAASIEIAIEDDGRGFVVPDDLNLEVEDTGNGLQNMQRRLRGIGGSLSVASEPGHGTRVVFLAPLALPKQRSKASLPVPPSSSEAP
ncbi:MAG: hypothetical protein H7A45_04385 [Verrucomicrobiales bacterium]|nr:hypothetical protein [Verrucomicrobiales bacterium]MCP5528421.1 hypothetical protein [Verrucomicrobiales bacterium]